MTDLLYWITVCQMTVFVKSPVLGIYSKRILMKVSIEN